MNDSTSAQRPAAAAPPPGDVKAIFDAGRKAHVEGRLDDAMARYREVLGLDPNYGPALNNLGVALKTLNRFAPAVACYRRALGLKPDDPSLLSNLGNALRGLGRFDEAEAVLNRALELKPGLLDAINNRALTYKGARRFPEAIAGLTELLVHRPNDGEAHLDLALTLLQSGDYERGFAEYEWRFQTKELPPRGLEAPMWDGKPLDGRTLLVHTEQGFGDSIQFVRYLPLVPRGGGGKVVLECRPELVRLFERMEGIDLILPRGEALPPFDVTSPLLSLPYLFGTTTKTIPAPTRYLSPPPKRAYEFRKRIRAPEDVLKIGIVWAGKPSHKNDHNRSASLSYFIDLLGTPGTAWYSLQVGVRADDIDKHHCGGLIDDLTPEIKDFADSAAAIDTLDLVISVDTAAVHLAGALGKPVWLALMYSGEWRYIHGRDDNPWYPTMRIFQQNSFGDWQGVFDRIGKALEAREGLPPAG